MSARRRARPGRGHPGVRLTKPPSTLRERYQVDDALAARPTGAQTPGRPELGSADRRDDEAPAGTAAGAAIGEPLSERVARIALPLACAAAWWVVAAYQREPPVAAEAGYLGLVVAAVLFAAFQAAPRIGALHGAMTVLLGAVPWALPGTPDRGAVVGLLLAGVVAMVAAEGKTACGAALAPRRLMALVVAAQLLARGGELLAPSTAAAVGVVAWAAIAAASLAVLQKRCGPVAAALAGASTFLLGPGFTAMSALALAAPALAALATDRALPSAARGAAGAVLLAPLAWDVERTALLLLGAVAFAGPTWARSTAGLAALAAFFAPQADRAAGLAGPAWLLVLLPIVVFAPRGQSVTRFAALCLALGTAAQSTDRAALAVPAALLALTVATTARAEGGGKLRHDAGERAGSGPTLVLATQASWIGVLAVATSSLAGYPWLRADAFGDAVSLLGLGEEWRAAATTLVVIGIALAVATLLARGLGSSARTPVAYAPRVLAVLLAALALSQHAATEATPIARQPVQLDAATPAWSTRLESPARVAALRLDSALSNAASIAPGTVVAEVHLETSGGARTLPLRAGVDTGEWAAQRPDVGAIAGFVAPEPFLHWVDASGRFFGQRYRARPRLGGADAATATATAIEVRLAPGAPHDLVLTIFHLELTR